MGLLKEENHPLVQDGLEFAYKYDVKSAITTLGTYLEHEEKKQIAPILLEALLRNVNKITY
jgi:hypothetical protein